MTATPSSRPIAAYGAFFGCTAIWGSTFLFIALGNDMVPPIWAATLRLGLASAILTAMSLASRNGLPRGPALVAAAWLGFFQFGLNFPLLYWGETVVPSGIASIPGRCARARACPSWMASSTSASLCRMG